jgi:hypothetical protein
LRPSPARSGGRRQGRIAARASFVAGLFAASAAFFSAVSLAGAIEWRLQTRADVRFLVSDAEQVWLDEGLDKLRFGDDDEPVALGAILADLSVRFVPTVSAHATVAIQDDVDGAIDPTEAYVEISPVPRSALRFRGRVGAFYPPGTLENRGLAWTSPFTLSFSAIDSWYAEELRVIGGEATLERMGRFASSSHDFALSLGAFRYNDPAGAMLSWRGWALHDRQTGLFERLPLAPLPNFGEDGLYYPVQGAFDEPFVELDGRTGWYAAGEWGYLDRSVVRALHYDNRGDPTVVDKGQWAWWTRFDRLGWQLRLTDRWDVVAQALRGSTRMDGFEGPLVDNEFAAASVLVSGSWGAHRATVRYDRFEVDDLDTTPDDPNDEEGDSWTAAWQLTPPRGWFPPRAGRLQLVAELLHVRSRRDARELFGGEASEDETLFQLAVQWRPPA